MKIVIHAGMHKTGTTSFQISAYHQRNELLQHGIYYPPSIDENQFIAQHSGIAFRLMAADLLSVSQYLERIATQAREKNAHTVLLSGEEFSSLAQDEQMFSRFLEVVDKCFDAYEIAVVTRDIVSQVTSNILEDAYACRIALWNRASIYRAARDRINLVMSIVASFQRMKNVSFIDYQALCEADGFCNALLNKCVGPLSFKLAENITNTFDEKIATISELALAALREGCAIVYGSAQGAEVMEKMVDKAALAAAFNLEELVRFAAGFKAVIREVVEQAVSEGSQKLSLVSR